MLCNWSYNWNLSFCKTWIE